MFRAAPAIALLAVTLASGCSQTSSTEPSMEAPAPSSATTSLSSSPPQTSPTASATSDAVATFCNAIRRDGAGPGDAFATVPLWNVAQAHKAASEQLALMKGAQPPSDIADDFEDWQDFLERVERASDDSDVDPSSLEPLLQEAKKREKAAGRLTDWAFDHCAG